MAKRRTRKQKKNAKHNIKITWDPNSGSDTKDDSVKGQYKDKSKKSTSLNASKKTTKNTASFQDTASIKKDIVKSLGLAGLILGLEVVIYFIL